MSDAGIRIGCAGAGILGSAIMRRLLDRRFDVRIWNRTPDKLTPLIDAGARAVAGPADLVRDAEFVLTCLTDGAAVEEVVFAERGIASAGSGGKLLIDMSTVEPEHSRRMAVRLRAECAMAWLDAPISGGAPAAREGRMAVMVGGEEADFEKARPVWDALAARCTLMGPSGAGQSTKMVNQVLVACAFAVLAEACGLAERTGVDASRIPGVFEGGRADSRLLQEFMPKMAASDFSIEGAIAVMLKDLDAIETLAAEVGTKLPMTAVASEMYRRLVRAGYGDRDNSELVNLYRDDPPA